MGVVYQARHLGWNIDVAIKHPRPEFLKSPDQVNLFRDECTTWASIGLHPYIATCFYIREIASLPCVLAEFLDGGSLGDAIENRSLYQGDYAESLSHMLAIAASTAWGLSRAHEARLLHCDVKPGNMLLNEYGTAKITDFGLALAFRPSRADAKAAGLTIPFSSPEQLRGDPLTPSADVWSWAASMLSMFTGGVTWGTGAACGAALRAFLDDGGKAYRIPALPGAFAELLVQCFRFSPDQRLSDFNQIAEQACEIHEQSLGEPCAAFRPDLELVSADSLNNRAVSMIDLLEMDKAHELLDEALTVDPLHPESIYNSALLRFSKTGTFPRHFLDRLEEVAKFEPGEYRPWLYRACLINLAGDGVGGEACMHKARERAEPHEEADIRRYWQSSSDGIPSFALSPPVSGEDFAADSARFERLMGKAQQAIQERDLANACRYLLMSGDIPGFGRHPRRRRLLLQLNT